MAEKAEDFFGAIAERYDSLARRGMPRYGEMLSALIDVTPDRVEDVLELGCGTGALTVRLSARYPEANLLALDGAPEMVALAQERLGEADVQRTTDVRFEVRRFEETELPRQSYDLIASNMSLHHVEDKAPFYARLHDAMKPGGMLAFGDELTGALPHIEELYWNGWLEFARQPDHLTEGEISEIIRHIDVADHYETLPDQLTLLKSAGFAAVDCIWRYLNYAVLVARA